MTLTTFTLRVRSVELTGATDDFGNPTRVTTERDWHVWGLAPGAQQEPPSYPNREPLIIAWTVYAPADGTFPDEDDEVQVDGEWLPVSGRASDWTRGPFGPGNAGVVVELRRVEG